MFRSRPLEILILVAVAVCCVNAASKFPEDIQKCNAKDAKVNECLKTAIIDGLKKLRHGKKSLGLLPLDPLAVDHITLDLGTPQAPFLFQASNVKVYGLTDSYIKSAKFNPEKFVLEFNSVTPNGTFVFDYEATGRILLLPVNGAGPGSFVFTDMDAVQRIEGVPLKKDGRVYWNITKYDIKYDAKKLDIRLDGLFKGNKQVSDQLSEFLLREWRLFLDQLRGPSGEAFGAIFQDLASRIFSRVPYGDIFTNADELVAKP